MVNLKIFNIGLVLLILLGTAGVFLFPHTFDPARLSAYFSRTVAIVHTPDSEPVELSGWVAQWEEDRAYSMLNETVPSLRLVAPQWYMVNKNFEIEEVGIKEKAAMVRHLKEKGMKVMVLMSSDLKAEELSPLLNSHTKYTALAHSAAEKATALGADGIDVDLELITQKDKEVYLDFLQAMQGELHTRGMEMSVCVPPQTGWDDWEGVLGVDIRRAAKIADEVHVMAYDKHGTGTLPGAIAPPDWVKAVARFSQENIPPEKLVFGVASYGYLWQVGSTTPEPMLYSEFMRRTQSFGYTLSRDSDTQELVAKKAGYEGWASDHVTIAARIALLQSLGIKQVIVWNLSGIDEELFRHAL